MHDNYLGESALTPTIALEQSFNTEASALVVVDSHLADAETLIQGIRPGAALLKLEVEDGIEKIAQAIESMGALEELHIVSHGSPGCLYLGNTELSLETLSQRAAQLAQWFEPDHWAASPKLLTLRL